MPTLYVCIYIYIYVCACARVPRTSERQTGQRQAMPRRQGAAITDRLPPIQWVRRLGPKRGSGDRELLVVVRHGCFEGVLPFPPNLEQAYVSVVQADLGIERQIREGENEFSAAELTEWPPIITRALATNGQYIEVECDSTDDACGIGCAGNSPSRAQACALATIIDRIVMQRQEG